MRNPHLRAITSSAVAVAAALVFCGAVFAHGGERYFIAEPSVVAPGGGVGVRADLPTTGPIALSLAGTDGTIRQVGVVEQTDGGHFEVLIQIPADVPVGQWTLRADVGGSAIASTTLEVGGTAIGPEQGGQGPRDQDDPLLVPLPSGWRTSTSEPQARGGSASVGSGGEPIDVVPFIAVGLAVAALAVFVVRTRPRAAP